MPLINWRDLDEGCSELALAGSGGRSIAEEQGSKRLGDAVKTAAAAFFLIISAGGLTACSPDRGSVSQQVVREAAGVVLSDEEAAKQTVRAAVQATMNNDQALFNLSLVAPDMQVRPGAKGRTIGIADADVKSIQRCKASSIVMDYIYRSEQGKITVKASEPCFEMMNGAIVDTKVYDVGRANADSGNKWYITGFQR